MLKKIFPFLAMIAVIGAGALVIRFYSYVFAKSVMGVIVKVERVNDQEMVISSGAAVPASQLFSFAVAVKDARGEIHTASTEDRQWAVALPGQCAEAKFFPYPPWQLDKAGTYHGARLLRLYECKSEAAGTTTAAPAATPSTAHQ